jgi:hypothetical protein
MKKRLVIILSLIGPLVVGCSHDTSHGSVAGRLLRVGGPLAAGLQPVPLPGRVIAVSSAGNRITVKVGPHGQFRISLPAGDYRLEGYSPRVRYNGADERCFATRSIHVTAQGHLRGVDVICPIH